MAIKYLSMHNYSDICEYVSQVIENQLFMKPNSNIAINATDDFRGIYSQIVNDVKKGKYNFNKVNFFLTEEIANVTKNTITSVYSFFDKNLLAPINMPANQIFFPITFAPTKDQQYDPFIFKNKAFDLSIVFLGKNGELGYIDKFKNYNSDYTSSFWLNNELLNNFKIMQRNSQLNSLEIYSIGSGALFNSKKILVIALELDKSNTIFKLMNAKTIDSKFAASMLLPHNDVTLIADAPAGLAIKKN